MTSRDISARSVRRCLATNTNIDLTYREFGNPADPLIVLIGGLNGQLVQWPDAFVAGLVELKRRVICLDNRDTGFSTKFDHVACPSMLSHALPRWARWLETPAPYTLADMALDVWALVDRVAGVGAKAHLLGTSMGGMIGQCATLLDPARVLSLTSIMSTTGAHDLPRMALSVQLNFLRTPKSDSLEDRVAFRLETLQRVFSVGVPYDVDEVLDLGRRMVERTTYMSGAVRHVAAISAAAPRDSCFIGLGRRAPPTLVVHGAHDVVFSVEHGRRTAEVISGARLVLVPDMGHHLHCAQVQHRILGALRDFWLSCPAV